MRLSTRRRTRARTPVARGPTLVRGIIVARHPSRSGDWWAFPRAEGPVPPVAVPCIVARYPDVTFVARCGRALTHSSRRCRRHFHGGRWADISLSGLRGDDGCARHLAIRGQRLRAVGNDGFDALRGCGSAGVLLRRDGAIGGDRRRSARCRWDLRLRQPAERRGIGGRARARCGGSGARSLNRGEACRISHTLAWRNRVHVGRSERRSGG